MITEVDALLPIQRPPFQKPPDWAFQTLFEGLTLLESMAGKAYEVTIFWKESMTVFKDDLQERMSVGLAVNSSPLASIYILNRFCRTATKLTILHELAHVATVGHHHDQIFWQTARKLYSAAEFPLAIQRKHQPLAWKVN